MNKKYLRTLIGGVMIIALFFVAARTNAEFNGRKIVVFKSDVSETEQDSLVKYAGGVKLKRLRSINSQVVIVPNLTAAARLAANPNILRVEDDLEMQALAQILPWGIDRVDAELVWPSGNTANAIKVGVIDTGISNKHSDLTANIKGGVNTINARKGWNDDNGHGSHVAGIIGGVNNTAGIIGMAPDADLYAIKVLNANGSGYVSDVMEGILWGVTNQMRVLNMSLGMSSDVQSMHDVVIAAYNAGVVIVAAAGNSGGSVNYPAAYPEVIAVGATDQNNIIAGFSSRGPEVDLAAPGVSIFSTYKGTGFATLSGTSMAAPHVAGAAALVLGTPVGAYDLDADGAWDPAEVLAKLKAAATDLGAAGRDDLYGAGLLNAFSAVQ